MACAISVSVLSFRASLLWFFSPGTQAPFQIFKNRLQPLRWHDLLKLALNPVVFFGFFWGLRVSDARCGARLAIDRSICILTRPVVITGFNWLLLVDWWSIGRLKKLG